MAPVVALPTLRSHRWGVHGACSLWVGSCGPSRTLSPLPLHPAALSSGGGPRSATVIPHPRGFSLSVLWRKHVASTAQARGAALVPLQGGGGGVCRVAPVVALPTLRSHPRCPPRWGLHGACFLRARSCGPSRTLSPLPPHLAALSSGGGGGLSAPPYLHPPPLGGRRCVGGGGGPCCLPFVARMSQAGRKHGAGTSRGTCPFAGWGACLVAPVVTLPTLRSHPRWSPRWGLHGACTLWARSCGPSRTLSPLPPHPAALSSGGGGAFCAPYLHPPPLGGRPCRLPFVARTSQARRKHGAGTRRGTCPSAGGGAT